MGALGLLSSLIMIFSAPSWNSKCAFRYCGRIRGIGLLESPFPVGNPGCGALHMCANEYRYSNYERRELYRFISEEGCEPP